MIKMIMEMLSILVRLTQVKVVSTSTCSNCISSITQKDCLNFHKVWEGAGFATMNSIRVLDFDKEKCCLLTQI